MVHNQYEKKVKHKTDTSVCAVQSLVMHRSYCLSASAPLEEWQEPRAVRKTHLQSAWLVCSLYSVMSKNPDLF